jgi:hypothetical protein
VEGDSLLNQFLRYGAADHFPEKNAVASYASHALPELAKNGYDDEMRVRRHLPLVDLKRCLENCLEHGAPFIKYVMSTIDGASPFGQDDWDAFTALDYAGQGAEEYGYKPEDPANQEDGEYVQAMGLLQGLLVFRTAVRQGVALLARVKDKVGAIHAFRSAYEMDKFRPEHGGTEILYHASAFCAELVRDGFQATKPEDRRGLGNYGSQSDISFTHNLEIAFTISRMLKELWMIGHGQLTARQIIGWMKAEGLDMKAAAFHVKLNDITKMSLQDTALLYRAYLTSSKIRINPFVTNPERTMEMLQNRSLKDIGVVACNVRLTRQDRYLAAEAEFRVPADRVISVKRVF